MRFLYVAHSWFIGAIIEPIRVDVKERVMIDTPDVWALLSTKGFSNPRDGESLAAFWSESTDIPPTALNAAATKDLSDPVYLQHDTPYRIQLFMRDYYSNATSNSIVEIVVHTNRSTINSGPVFVRVSNEVLHVITRDEKHAGELEKKAFYMLEVREFEEAARQFRQVVEMLQGKIDDDGERMAHLRQNLGTALINSKNFEQGTKEIEAALPFFEKKFGREKERNLLPFLEDLNFAYDKLNLGDKRKNIIDRINLIKERHGIFFHDGEIVIHPDYIKRMENAEHEDNWEETIKFYKQIIDLAKEHIGVDSLEYSEGMIRLAAAYFQAHKYREAKEYAKKSIQIVENRQLDGEKLGLVYNNFASVLRELGEVSEAEKYYEKALGALQTSAGSAENHRAFVLQAYAVLMKKVGRDDRARDLISEASRIKDA